MVLDEPQISGYTAIGRTESNSLTTLDIKQRPKKGNNRLKFLVSLDDSSLSSDWSLAFIISTYGS